MLGDQTVPGLYLLAAHDIFALLSHVHKIITTTLLLGTLLASLRYDLLLRDLLRQVVRPTE